MTRSIPFATLNKAILCTRSRITLMGAHTHTHPLIVEVYLCCHTDSKTCESVCTIARRCGAHKHCRREKGSTPKYYIFVASRTFMCCVYLQLCACIYYIPEPNSGVVHSLLYTRESHNNFARAIHIFCNTCVCVRAWYCCSVSSKNMAEQVYMEKM